MRHFLVALVLLTALNGCDDKRGDEFVPVKTEVPIIALPSRPNLEKLTADELAEYLKLPPAVREKLEKNNEALMTYAAQLDVAIVEYNGFAKFSNQANAEWVGKMDDKKKPKK